MFPYLIAGAIGFVVAKIFKDDEAPKYEIGGIFQGTPHDFNVYSAEYIGTGEGNQVFGWGLYFTDLKDVARYYMSAGLYDDEQKIMLNGKSLSKYKIQQEVKDQLVGIIETIFGEDKLVPTLPLIKGYLVLEYDEENYPEFKELVELCNKTYDFIKDKKLSFIGNIYSVILFKGKNPKDYNLLEWEVKPTKEELDLIKNQLHKEGIIVSRDLGIGKDNRFKGEYLSKILEEQKTSYTDGTKNSNLYTELSAFLGSDKKASLLLLRAGIYGIKYKAGSISGMEDKEGYNYVIFDANDITIEGKEKYEEILAGNEKYADGGLIAPNGKPSNLTPEQYKLVRSKAFKNWFGDWENDPNDNMLIDKNGEPMIWFHTGGDWTKLNDDGINGKGKLMFSPTKSSMAYGRDGKQTITRPFFIKSDFIYMLPYEDRDTSSAYRWNKNKKNPIWFVNAYGGFVVVRQSNQIKLADGTNTTFDGGNPDIRYNDGGVTDEYLKYFKENNIIVNNISDLGSGDYSKTYKIDTNKGEFALNIRSEMVGDYSSLIDEYYDYLPTIYDVRNINGEYCIVMEVLLPISKDEKNIIDCIDYLFYANDDDGLDVWLEDNLRYDLYLKVEELMGETDIDRISEKQYIDKLKWFYDNYGDYETFINDIQSAFQEYNEALGFNYVDFHGDNLMQDKYGQVKLIDL